MKSKSMFALAAVAVAIGFAGIFVLFSSGKQTHYDSQENNPPVAVTDGAGEAENGMASGPPVTVQPLSDAELTPEERAEAESVIEQARNSRAEEVNYAEYEAIARSSDPVRVPGNPITSPDGRELDDSEIARMELEEIAESEEL